MKPSRGLGKGLSALFSETEEDYGKSLIFDEQPEDVKAGVTEIEISSIFANPNQPRKVFNETALRELADSIEKHGVIMPIIVNKSGDRYMIIAGERRFRASKLAGLKTVPVIVKNYNERQIKEISLIENLQREDLNPMEEAMGYNNLILNYGLTQEEVAKTIGKSRPAIANSLRLLSLPEEVIDMLSKGELSAGHGKALLAFKTPEEQIANAEKAVKEGLSVRELEKLAGKKKKDSGEKKEQSQNHYYEEVRLALNEHLGRKVTLSGTKKKGEIKIEFYGEEDLKNLLSDLKLDK